MNSYSGYKLKPKEYSIQPNDIIIRVIPGAVAVPTGTIAIALEDSCVALAPHQCWPADFTDWRAIETKIGQKAVAGDTVYCIKDTGGSCHQHDSFRITDCYQHSNCISPIKDHILLNGTITGQGWNWKAIDFVVLVKADAKEIQEFPCFRRAIENKHIVKFTTPTKGTVVDVGTGIYVLNYAYSYWVDYDDYSIWEPCEDPAISHIPVDAYKAKAGDYVEWADNSERISMTKGQLYKVVEVRTPSILLVLNNYNEEDVWSKYRFKRVPDKAIQEPLLISSDDHIDALAYALRIPISYISIDSMMHKPTQIKPRETSFPIYKIKTGEEIICVGKDKHGWFKSVDSKGTLTRHNPRFYTLDKPKQTNSKGKQMNSNLFTDILKLLTQTEQTDLEKAPSTYAFFYNNEGEYEGTARVANEAEAKALLQKPEHLGYTMRIYTFSDEFTTQIPVVSTIKKTVVDKPVRKTRVSKA